MLTERHKHAAKSTRDISPGGKSEEGQEHGGHHNSQFLGVKCTEERLCPSQGGRLEQTGKCRDGRMRRGVARRACECVFEPPEIALARRVVCPQLQRQRPKLGLGENRAVTKSSHGGCLGVSVQQQDGI